MLVDRDAAPVVGNGQPAGGTGFFLQRHFDAVGMACHRLIHRVVEHFSGEMVQGTLVGAADIHAGAPADGLEPLQHLDCGTIVGFPTSGRQLVEQVIGHGRDYTQRLNPRSSAHLRLSSDCRAFRALQRSIAELAGRRADDGD